MINQLSHQGVPAFLILVGSFWIYIISSMPYSDFFPPKQCVRFIHSLISKAHVIAYYGFYEVDYFTFGMERKLHNWFDMNLSTGRETRYSLISTRNMELIQGKKFNSSELNRNKKAEVELAPFFPLKHERECRIKN